MSRLIFISKQKLPTPITLAFVCFIGLLLQSCALQKTSPKPKVSKIWPKVVSRVEKDPAIEERVTNIMASMTMKQKVAQMVQPEVSYFSVSDMREYGFGSYLIGGSTYLNGDRRAPLSAWLNVSDKLYNASVDDSIDGTSIPTMWGIDAVHGHNNAFGATIFPHNIGLGATQNPALIRKIAVATATEVAATGIDWSFSPTVAVPRDDRWGRTYEGYAESPQLVSNYAEEMIEGLQGMPGGSLFGEGKIIATVKHFVGDGGTQNGTDRGDTVMSEEELYNIHAAGYISAIEAGVQAVMASFTSWNGEKLHGHRYLLTDVLKNRMGFDGIVVTDWNGHGLVPGCTNVSCAPAINAGVDIIMVPEHWKPFIENTLKQVADGTIKEARIDDAVRRILRVKLRYKLFDKGNPASRAVAGEFDKVGSKEHRDLARQAVRESLVLLKNNKKTLPLNPKLNILVAGDGADNLSKQTGGWSLTWSGDDTTKADFPNSTSIYDGIKSTVEKAGGTVTLDVEGNFKQKPDAAIVVFGEKSYAEWFGDIRNLEFQEGEKKDLALLKKLKAQGIPVVSVFLSGRPLWVNAEINASDAFVAAWLPGTEGNGVAELLFTKADGSVNYDFTGKLSFSWPNLDNQYELNPEDENYSPLFAYGHGLNYKSNGPELAQLSEIKAAKPFVELPTEPKSLFNRHLPESLTFQIGNKYDWGISLVGPYTETKVSDTVTIRTVNWKYQEDSRRIAWSGDMLGTAMLFSFSMMDLSGYLESNAAMSFNLRLEKEPTSQVHTTMTCGGNNCGGKVDITDNIKKLPLDEWQAISIDLNCFAKDGMDLGFTLIPWQIQTEGELGLSVNTIELLPNQATQADISCTN